MKGLVGAWGLGPPPLKSGPVEAIAPTAKNEFCDVSFSNGELSQLLHLGIWFNVFATR